MCIYKRVSLTKSVINKIQRLLEKQRHCVSVNFTFVIFSLDNKYFITVGTLLLYKQLRFLVDPPDPINVDDSVQNVLDKIIYTKEGIKRVLDQVLRRNASSVHMFIREWCIY